MYIPHMQTPLVMTWLVALTLAGVLGDFGIPGWLLLSVLALFPLVVLRQVERSLAPTLSETIRDARR